MCIITPFTVEKISPRASLELGIARSVGQHLNHGATGAPKDQRVDSVDLDEAPRNEALNYPAST